jgi:hypothetical protein
MIKLKEILRGARQSLMMKGMDGDRKGELDLDADVEELDELHFTSMELNVVRQDILDFLSSERKKLKHANPLDTYNLVLQVLDSHKTQARIRGI